VRRPDSAHTDRPWRVHEVAGDFELEDVWAPPTHSSPDGLPRLVRQFASDDDADLSAVAVRVLLAIRSKIGSVLRWDRHETGVGARVGSLRHRLPPDLLAGPRGPDLHAVPFRSIYPTGDEWVADSANRTVQALLHIGWVPDGRGAWRGQMAALTSPSGALGAAYMAGSETAGGQDRR